MILLFKFSFYIKNPFTAPADSLVKLRQTSLSKVFRIWSISVNTLEIVLVLEARVFS